MKAWGALAAILVVALGLAALALRTPMPRPLDAPAAAFSAARAMADVNAIATAPHPMGSPQAARVRAYLMGRMAALGLAPQARPFESPQGPGVNLLGVLRGEDPAMPAILLMAHSDSVPTGPGAADDGAGVAAALETVRALSVQHGRRRDVMVLITDGEEAGLLGAKAFFAADPARAHVGFVINLEARGDRGRAVMFETHKGAAPLIAFLVDHNALGGASSLMPDVYRRLPNDTDLTVALKQGIDGVNFAFFAGFNAYHRPSDTPAALDPGSLQHIGAQALAAAQALVRARLPGHAPDQVYADVLGGPVLQYPAVVAWAILVLGALGLLGSAIKALQERRTSPWGMAAGAGAFAGLIVAIGLVLYLAGLLRHALAGPHFAPLLRHPGQVLAGIALMAAGLGLVWLWAAAKAIRPASLALGALMLIGALSVALQVVAPLDAFIFVFPWVLTVVGQILGGTDRRMVGPLFALAALAQLFYWTGLVFSLVGQATPATLLPFAALGAMVLLTRAPVAGPTAALIGAGWTSAGLALSLLALLA
jgi:hypothetical protein